MEHTETTKKSRSGKWIVLFVLSLLGNGYLFFEYYNSHLSPKARSSSKQLAALKLDYGDLKAIKEDLEKELETVRQHLEQTMNEHIDFQTMNDELRAKVDEQTLRIRQLINRGGSGDAAALLQAKAEIERLKKENVEYLIRVDSLKQTTDEFSGRIADAERTAQDKTSEAKKLKAKTDSIQSSLMANSLLQVQDLKIEPVRAKKGEDDLIFKANKVERIKVQFMLNGIDLAEKGNQDIILRIIGTNNEVLTNNNDILTDSDQLITDKKTVNFEGKPIKIKFNYAQNAAYKKGTYEVEILHKGQLINMGSFILE